MMPPRATVTEQSSFNYGLHFAFQSDMVLFNNLVLSSWPEFWVTAAITCAICLLERLITMILASKARWSRADSSPAAVVLWRTTLYAVVTTLRLMYMLISMTLHLGLIAVMVGSLAVGQMYIEYREVAASTGFSNNSPIRAKASGYSPISPNPLNHHHHHHHPATYSEYDLEMANASFSSSPPPSTSSTAYDSGSRDKARQIMSGGAVSSSSSPFTPRPRHQTHSVERTSPVHRRQSASVDPVKKSYNHTPKRLSGTNLAQSGRGSPPSSASLTGTGAPRRQLFQIGGTSGEEDRTSDSD